MVIEREVGKQIAHAQPKYNKLCGIFIQNDKGHTVFATKNIQFD